MSKTQDPLININKEQALPKYDRKKLFELSLKTIGEVPQIDDLNEEQEEFVKNWRASK